MEAPQPTFAPQPSSRPPSTVPKFDTYSDVGKFFTGSPEQMLQSLNLPPDVLEYLETPDGRQFAARETKALSDEFVEIRQASTELIARAVEDLAARGCIRRTPPETGTENDYQETWSSDWGRTWINRKDLPEFFEIKASTLDLPAKLYKTLVAGAASARLGQKDGASGAPNHR